jgi:hypothetical protein
MLVIKRCTGRLYFDLRTGEKELMQYPNKHRGKTAGTLDTVRFSRVCGAVAVLWLIFLSLRNSTTISPHHVPSHIMAIALALAYDLL